MTVVMKIIFALYVRDVFMKTSTTTSTTAVMTAGIRNQTKQGMTMGIPQKVRNKCTHNTNKIMQG